MDMGPYNITTNQWFKRLKAVLRCFIQMKRSVSPKAKQGVHIKFNNNNRKKKSEKIINFFIGKPEERNILNQKGMNA